MCITATKIGVGLYQNVVQKGRKKNDPPILALLRGLAGSRTAKIVQIFISTPKNADWFRVGINQTSLFLHSPRTFFEISKSCLFLLIFLHQTTTLELPNTFSFMLFLILFLHQTTTLRSILFRASRLFLILFLHQTTTLRNNPIITHRCFLSYFYIKPQHMIAMTIEYTVVSYLISTSNHNLQKQYKALSAVVSYLISTSNHNCMRFTENN